MESVLEVGTIVRSN